MSAASFLHSSFLQPIKAVMLYPVHVQKVPRKEGLGVYLADVPAFEDWNCLCSIIPTLVLSLPWEDHYDTGWSA